MTIGMFIPAFSFTFIGHNLFEKLTQIKLINDFLDGITAAVVGLIFITSFELLKSSLTDLISVVIFILTLASLYYFNHRFLSLFVVFASAIVGQVVYAPQ